MTEKKTPSERTRHIHGWIGVVCRLVLGLVLLIAGAIKLPDLDASVISVTRFQLGLPEYWMVQALGYGLPIIEVALGLLLLVGLFTRLSALLGGLMMLAYAIGIASVWIRGIALDCGCFGSGSSLDRINPWVYGWDIVRDIALFAMGMWLFLRPRTPFSLDERLRGADLDDLDTFDAATDTENL